MSPSPHRIKYYATEIISVATLWIVFALLCVYIKFDGIPDGQLRKIYSFHPSMTKLKLYQMAFLIALFLGLVTGLAHTLLYPAIIRTRNFFANLAIRILIFLLLTISTLSLFLALSGLPTVGTYLPNNYLLSKSIMEVFSYLIILEVIVGLTVTLRRNLGKGYLKKFIRSSYFIPQVEYRVFMFTDLKNSTMLVERMGSLNFSSFIQDCFRDFSNVALDLGGEIYQFVGDEVVTTWKVRQDFDYSACTALHFAMASRLKSRKQYYINRYEIFPEFRSSIHCGEVSSAVVGEFKSEIAYHGGVLNLCSRLQNVCRDYDAELVTSEDFHDRISITDHSRYSPITDIELKGISKKQLVYRVDKP